MEIKLIKKKDIELSDWNPRSIDEEDEELKKMKISIAKIGPIEPIIIRRNPRKKGKYLLTAGYKRWLTYKDNEKIYCIVRNDTELEAMIIAHAENSVRSDYTDIERERFITKIYEEGLNAKKWKNINQMAKIIGQPVQKITTDIKAYRDRNALGLRDHEKISTSDLKESSPLKKNPKYRKKLLLLRENGQFKKSGHIVHTIAKKYEENISKSTTPCKLEDFITDILKESTPNASTETKIQKSCETNEKKILTPLAQDNSNQSKKEISPIEELATDFVELTYNYGNILKLIAPNFITRLNKIQKEEIISKMKEIRDHIDELIAISEKRPYFVRHFYKNLP